MIGSSFGQSYSLWHIHSHDATKIEFSKKLKKFVFEKMCAIRSNFNIFSSSLLQASLY